MVATKRGIAQKCKMDTREEVTEDEEAIWLWEKGPLGGFSAESLMYTISFFFSGFKLANIPGEGVLPHKNDGGFVVSFRGLNLCVGAA